jgi:8-oxo-dGTP pyrophosphatase MutT (NUDIX family)
VTGGELRVRSAARVLLLDPDGDVLLIHERIEGGTHWITPGGGVEDDESLLLTAAREVYEETGLRIELPGDAEAVHVAQREWHWRGEGYRQTDYYFLLRLGDRPAVGPAALTAMEDETLLGFRWWSLDELRANTSEAIVPSDIADLLDRLGGSGPPSAPAG